MLQTTSNIYIVYKLNISVEECKCLIILGYGRFVTVNQGDHVINKTLTFSNQQNPHIFSHIPLVKSEWPFYNLQDFTYVHNNAHQPRH